MLRFIQTLQDAAPEDIARVMRENNVSETMATLLLGRGLSSYEEIQKFLHPSIEHMHDPFLLPDMKNAVLRVRRAIAEKEPVCVYGDYDADGICATAILLQYLISCGANASAFVPSRHQEGYGMNEDAVRRLFRQGIRLIITVDNGIAAAKEVALCNSLGMDVIVTDHHQCPPKLPECVAVVNPHRQDSGYPNRHLCGAGVALKLVQALGGRKAIEEYLPLAALATVADVVELKGENRAIVAAGMKGIEQHTGLSALLSVSGSAGQIITSGMLAFRIAPRINAAGRMGDASRALSLLIETDAAKARGLALTLNDENERRQAEEQRILREAREMLLGKDVARMRAILLYSPDWNPGITGIVAAKLVEEYYRPVLLFHQQGEALTGSCRSIPGVHLYECLKQFGDRFIRFGGHAQAAGVTMRLNAFESFALEFDTYLRGHIPPCEYIPVAKYELCMPLNKLSQQEVSGLNALAPYGEGNPQPVFCARGVRLEDVSRMGRDEQHLRAIAVQENRRAGLVAFGLGRKAQEWSEGGIFDLLYTPELNDWQNTTRLQLMLRAVKSVSFFDDPSYIPRHRLKFYDAFFRNVLYNVSRSAVIQTLKDFNEAVVRSLSDNVHGTLIACATPEGAMLLRDLLQEHGLEDAAGFYWNTVPAAAGSENAVLLAPNWEEMKTARFDGIFIFDGDANARFPYSERNVFVSEQNAYDGLLAPLRISREGMGRIYRTFAERLKNGSTPRAVLLNEAGAQSRETAIMAMLTFIELGFFQWNAQTDTISAVQDVQPRNLWESSIYMSANREAEAADAPA
jgi:single-stranded-DNA-specific exonuclease